jgi:hypothetical protein
MSRTTLPDAIRATDASRPSRRLLAALATLAIVAGVAAGPAAGPVEAAPVYYSATAGAPRISVIGDSVMAAIRWYGTWSPLRRFNYTVDVESCRRTLAASCRGREGFAPDTTVNAMRRLRGQLGSVLVVGTGYDDPGFTFGNAVDAVMAEAAAQGIPVVIWATMRTAGVSYVGPHYAANATTYLSNNRILYTKAAQYGGRLQVADWASYSASHREWVTPDGIHLTPSGSTAMADFIADQAAGALQRISSPGGLRAAVAPSGGAGSGQVLLTWSLPTYSNGRAVTDYAIQYSADGGATWQTFADAVSARRWYMAGGLTNGLAYRFRVAAYTSAGWGRYSAAIIAKPRVAKPSAPLAVTARSAPSYGMGSGQVLLTWSPPTYTSGRVVTDYRIQRSADGGATWHTFPDGVSRNPAYIASGLTNGLVYRFRVAAYTSAGWGPYSTVVAATPRVAKPSPPSGLVAAPGPGSGEVQLTWGWPGYNGGRAVTDYAIRYSADGGATWQTIADGVSARRWHQMSGLTNGVTYQFRVAAYTSAGWGTFGNVATAVPTAPALLAAPASEPPPAEETTATTEVPASSSPAPAVVVGDLVWLDSDGDGVQDADEPGLGAVVVRLLDAAGTVVDEAVSDVRGVYELSASSPGPFAVEVVLPAGYRPTLVDVGPDETVDSDVDPLDVVVGPVETTVRVDHDGTGLDGLPVDLDLDIGLVAEPASPPTIDTEAEPATSTTEAPTTTAVPTTTAPTTVAPTTPTSTSPPPTSTTTATTVAPTEPPTTETAAPVTVPAG